MTSLHTFLSQQSISSDLVTIFSSIESASKVIRNEVQTAGLRDILGAAGEVNVQGEEVQKLDLFANDCIKQALGESGAVAYMASEEEDDVIIPRQQNKDGYVLLFDPLDGSSNIDVNVSVGTIFSIYKAIDDTAEANCLQHGRRQVAAGYVLFGTSTMCILTLGNGVFGFTYDPEKDAFLLSHNAITIPEKTTFYSINEGLTSKLNEGTKSYLNDAKARNISARYVGSLVSDFHRNLLKGGLYIYPGISTHPNGKLRLLYEANPLSFICEQAGGKSSDGRTPILDIQPQELHQRVPLYIGTEEGVSLAEQFERTTLV